MGYGHLCPALLVFSLVVGLLGPASGIAQTTAATPAPAAKAAASLAFQWQSTGGSSPLDGPYGMAVAPDGTLWVADGRHDHFQLLAADGAYQETWGTPGSGEGEFDFAAIFGGQEIGEGDIAFAPDGSFYVADTGNHRVQHFAPDRSFRRAWGSEGEGDGQFRTPSSIAVGSDGSVYVGDEERGDVQRFSADGQFLTTIGRYGTSPGEFFLPAGITVDAENTLWVVDWSLHRVQRFRPEGELLAQWGTAGTTDGALNSPNDIAVDAQGRVYVWDDGNWRIQVFTLEGRFLAKVQGYGLEPGQFLSGAGLALGPDGTLYVSDSERDDVQAFRLILPQSVSKPANTGEGSIPPWSTY